MAKIEIDNQNIGFPMPVAVLGTRYEGRPNFMAVAWLTRVNTRPPQIAVSVGRSNASAKAVLEHGWFGLSFPDQGQLVATDYAGLASGKRTDKSDIFPIFFGESDAAPMAENCPVTMECRLAVGIELQTSMLFIADIVTTYTEEQYLSDGRIDLKKTHPLLLSMPENQYYSLAASSIGRAWSVGRDYRNQR